MTSTIGKLFHPACIGQESVDIFFDFLP